MSTVVALTLALNLGLGVLLGALGGLLGIGGGLVAIPLLGALYGEEAIREDWTQFVLEAPGPPAYHPNVLLGVLARGDF